MVHFWLIVVVYLSHRTPLRFFTPPPPPPPPTTFLISSNLIPHSTFRYTSTFSNFIFSKFFILSLFQISSRFHSHKNIFTFCLTYFWHRHRYLMSCYVTFTFLWFSSRNFVSHFAFDFYLQRSVPIFFPRLSLCFFFSNASSVLLSVFPSSSIFIMSSSYSCAGSSERSCDRK